jgi:hypothetical protein
MSLQIFVPGPKQALKDSYMHIATRSAVPSCREAKATTLCCDHAVHVLKIVMNSSLVKVSWLAGG